MSNYLQQGQELPLANAAPVRVCLSWDLFPGGVQTDLDCAALAFDACSTLDDACFYNQLTALSGSVKHSGDERDGSKEGFDEVISIDLPRIPPHIHVFAFVVNAYQGGTLADVETARATIQQEGAGELCSVQLCCGTRVAATAAVCFLMFKRGEHWCLRNVQEEAQGRTFAETYPAILKSLQAVLDPALIAERRANMDKTFKMSKDDVMEIPEDLFVAGEDLFVGLGWDTRADLDAAVLLADNCLPETGQERPEDQLGLALNIVNFRDKAFGKAVIHHGDNTTGEGAGDDERIDLDLDFMPPEVKSFWVVVNMYTENCSFKDVKKAFLRLVAARNGHELCRFNLTDESTPYRGIVLAKISRNAVGRWCVRTLGRGCGGRTANDPATMRACDLRGMADPATIRRVEASASRPSEAMRTWTILTITLKGVKLAAKDGWLMGGKSDPYFEIWDMSPGEANKKLVARSETIMKTLDPNWKQVMCEVRAGQVLRIVVWDYDKLSSPDLIGYLDVGSYERLPHMSGQHKLIPPPPPHKQEAGHLEFVSVTVRKEISSSEEPILQARRWCESNRKGGAAGPPIRT